MLLRRYIKHLNTQNWTAVFLDFIIVVFGLFIGLQIDSWNDDRKNAALEKAYLEQLQADFSQNVEQLDWLWEAHNGLAQDLMFAIGVVKGGELAEADAERLKWAVMRMYQVPPLSLNMATYEAMMASGDLAIIRDRELRSLLVSIDSIVRAEQSSFWRRPDNYFVFPEDVRFEIARAIPHPSGRGVALELDFDALVGFPGTLSILSEKRRTHAMIAEARSELRDRFMEANIMMNELNGRN